MFRWADTDDRATGAADPATTRDRRGVASVWVVLGCLYGAASWGILAALLELGDIVVAGPFVLALILCCVDLWKLD